MSALADSSRSNLKLLSKILRLNGMKITGFQFKNYGRELHLSIKPYKTGCFCADCGRRGRLISQSKEVRSWQDIAVLVVLVALWYWPKEIECAANGRAQERYPMGGPVLADHPAKEKVYQRQSISQALSVLFKVLAGGEAEWIRGAKAETGDGFIGAYSWRYCGP